jgi:hypothetical protein
MPFVSQLRLALSPLTDLLARQAVLTYFPFDIMSISLSQIAGSREEKKLLA